jgi:hypothetical protein
MMARILLDGITTSQAPAVTFCVEDRHHQVGTHDIELPRVRQPRLGPRHRNGHLLDAPEARSACGDAS